MQLTVPGASQLGRRLSTGEPWQKARVCVDKLHRLASVVAASDVGAIFLNVAAALKPFVLFHYRYTELRERTLVRQVDGARCGHPDASYRQRPAAERIAVCPETRSRQASGARERSE